MSSFSEAIFFMCLFYMCIRTIQSPVQCTNIRIPIKLFVVVFFSSNFPLALCISSISVQYRPLFSTPSCICISRRFSLSYASVPVLNMFKLSRPLNINKLIQLVDNVGGRKCRRRVITTAVVVVTNHHHHCRHQRELSFVRNSISS